MCILECVAHRFIIFVCWIILGLCTLSTLYVIPLLNCYCVCLYVPHLHGESFSIFVRCMQYNKLIYVYQSNRPELLSLMLKEGAAELVWPLYWYIKYHIVGDLSFLLRFQQLLRISIFNFIF